MLRQLIQTKFMMIELINKLEKEHRLTVEEYQYLIDNQLIER